MHYYNITWHFLTDWFHCWIPYQIIVSGTSKHLIIRQLWLLSQLDTTHENTRTISYRFQNYNHNYHICWSDEILTEHRREQKYTKNWAFFREFLQFLNKQLIPKRNVTRKRSLQIRLVHKSIIFNKVTLEITNHTQFVSLTPGGYSDYTQIHGGDRRDCSL